MALFQKWVMVMMTTFFFIDPRSRRQNQKAKRIQRHAHKAKEKDVPKDKDMFDKTKTNKKDTNIVTMLSNDVRDEGEKASPES